MNNKFKLVNFTIVAALACTFASCATIIGGNQPTDKTTGSSVGPATIGSGDQTLQNDRFSALTVTGDLNANKITIVNDLNIESNATLNKVTVRDDTIIKGNLTITSCTFKDSTIIGNNIDSIDSYFGNGITFGGTQLTLKARSKVIGDIRSNSKLPATIIIDKSVVKGNISFAQNNGKVILQNGGKLKGQVNNGRLINQ